MAFNTGSAFGAAPSSSLFGSSQTGFGSSPPANQQRPAFGAGAPGGGSSLFGASAAGFGGGSVGGAFGSQQPSVGGFGSAAPTGAFGQQNQAGGLGSSLFGSSNPQQQPSGGGIFGSSTVGGGGGAFGAQPSGGGGAFGAQPSGGGGAFGAQPSGGGLFGQSTQPAPAFGSSTGFGQQASGFGGTGAGQFGGGIGAAQSSGGLFGSGGGGTGVFGQQQTQSAFGSAPPSGGGGLFGSANSGAFGQQPAGGAGSAFGSAGTSSFGAPLSQNGFFGSGTGGVGSKGTVGIKWDVTVETDGNPPQRQKYNSITMMPNLKAKGLEELRLEDYEQGAIFPQAQSGFGGTQTANQGLFSSSQSQPGGLFGQSSAPASGFGSSLGNSFGAAQTGSGLFGAQGQSGFGSQPSSASGGIFGGGASSTFGQPQSSSLFGGAASTGASAFGAASASSSGSLFGSQPTAAAQSSAFGGTSGFGGFGAAAAPSQPSLFGSAPSSSFGAAAAQSQGLGGTGQGLFGASSGEKPGGLFGAQTSSAPALGSTSLFAASGSALGGSSLFGAGSGSAGGFGTSLGSSANQTTAAQGLGSFGGGSSFGGSSNFGLGGLGGLGGTSSFGQATGTTGSTFQSQPGGLFGGQAGAGTTASFGNASGSGIFGSSGAAAPPPVYGAPAEPTKQGPLYATIDGNPFGSAHFFPIDPTPRRRPPKPEDLFPPASSHFPRYLGSTHRHNPRYGDSAPGHISRHWTAPHNRAAVRPKPAPRWVRNHTLRDAEDMFTTRFRKAAFGSQLLSPSSPRTERVWQGPSASYKPKTTYKRSARVASLKTLVIRPPSERVKPAFSTERSERSEERDVGLDAVPADPALYASTLRHRKKQENMEDKTSPEAAATGSPSFPADPSEGLQSPATQTGVNGLVHSNEHETTPVAEQESHGSRPQTPSSSRGILPTDRDEVEPVDGNLSTLSPPTEEFVEPVGEGEENEEGRTRLGRDYQQRPRWLGTPRYASPKKAGPNPLAPKLTLPTMKTEPPIEQLRSMTDAELASVEDFRIIATGIGEIHWPGKSDVRGFNIDQDVSIRRDGVDVYLDDDKVPKVGTKLNKLARIQIENIWKYKQGTTEPIKNASAAYEVVKTLKQYCDDEGFVFLGYDVRSGIYRFETEYF